jgi:phosphoglycerate dehydrogenase-like enzyme
VNVLALNLAAYAAQLDELTRGLDVRIAHHALPVPWEEIAARRAGRTTDGTRATPALAAALAEAEVLFAFAPPLDSAALATRLRWTETPATGVDQLNGTGLLERRDVAVTNVGGLFAPWVAEHVFTLLFGIWRKLDVMIDAQRRGAWAGRGIELRGLSGATMAIVGLGNIGQATARAAHAFGMRVIGTRRNHDEAVPHVERVYPRRALHEMLAAADVVVLAVAGSAETERLIGAAELAAMKRSATLINVARGMVLDEAALAAALHDGTIAAAGLDVYVDEPPAADSPLWKAPNLLMTPHIAVNVGEKLARCVEHFADNLRRFRHGEALRDRVTR